MIPHVSRLLELWRIAAHYRLDTLFPAEELPEKARHVASSLFACTLRLGQVKNVKTR